MKRTFVWFIGNRGATQTASEAANGVVVIAVPVLTLAENTRTR